MIQMCLIRPAFANVLGTAAALLLLAVADARAADAGIAAHAERKCLAEALYFEAGTEDYDGHVAVAEVIFRRVADPAFPGTICKVVYQGLARGSCQFSFACDGARVRPRGRVLWRQCWNWAGDFIARRKAVLADDTTKGATHFHTIDVSPDWETAYGLEQTVQIGRHIFYRPKE